MADDPTSTGSVKTDVTGPERYCATNTGLCCFARPTKPGGLLMARSMRLYQTCRMVLLQSRRSPVNMPVGAFSFSAYPLLSQPSSVRHSAELRAGRDLRVLQVLVIASALLCQ